jgi:hypothetical protein
MKVYIVLHGEQCEGGSVVSVHKTEKSAVKAALNVRCCFAGGWVLYSPLSWENGCDFVKVEEWDVQK